MKLRQEDSTLIRGPIQLWYKIIWIIYSEEAFKLYMQSLRSPPSAHVYGGTSYQVSTRADKWIEAHHQHERISFLVNK